MAHVPTEARRQQFIDAAITVIARVGVDGATTRKIAEEAAAPLATLHYCFHTKDKLLWAVFEQLADLVRIGIEQSSPEGKSVDSIASQLLSEAIRSAIERPAANRAQIEIWLWAERNDQEFALRLYEKFIDTSKDFLRKAGTPLPEDQLETVARVVTGLVDGLCMQLITHGNEKTILRELDTATEMLSVYLGPRSRRSA